VGTGVLLGTGVELGTGSEGEPPGSVVPVGVAVGVGGGWVEGRRVFVLVGNGLGVRVLVGTLVHVGQMVTKVDEAVGLDVVMAVLVAVAETVVDAVGVPLGEEVTLGVRLVGVLGGDC
jgi:hypothetical protein